MLKHFFPIPKITKMSISPPCVLRLGEGCALWTHSAAYLPKTSFAFPPLSNKPFSLGGLCPNITFATHPPKSQITTQVVLIFLLQVLSSPAKPG